MNENELLRAILGLCQQWVTNTSGSPPVNLTLPLIDDPVPTELETLYVTDGTWDVPVTITYEWEINGVLNPFENQDVTVVPSAGDVFRCKVTATSAGRSTSVFTAATAASVSHATPVCVLKLYADNIVQSPVGDWPDYSGQGNSATQGTVPNQPVLAAGPNGKLAVQFDGVDDFLSTTTGLVTTTATVFLVLKPAALSNAYTSLISNERGGTNTGITYLLKSNGKTAFYWTPDSGGGTNYDGTGGATLNTTDWVIASLDWNASGGTSFINAVTDGIIGALSGSATTDGMLLGASVIAGRYLNGYVAALVIFNTALTTPQRQAVEAYLSANYAI